MNNPLKYTDPSGYEYYQPGSWDDYYSRQTPGLNPYGNYSLNSAADYYCNLNNQLVSSKSAGSLAAGSYTTDAYGYLVKTGSANDVSKAVNEVIDAMNKTGSKPYKYVQGPSQQISNADYNNGLSNNYKGTLTTATQTVVTAHKVFVMPDVQGSGGDLGTVGNFIRSQAGSEFSQSLFTNYWQAGGNMKLSQLRFNNIVQAAGRVQSISPVTLANGQAGIAKVHSFYGSSEYAKAFGSATIYYNQGGSPVGFNDTYDFNWRWQWGDGSRSIIAEQQTRAVSIAGFFYGAQPFNITYGISVHP